MKTLQLMQDLYWIGIQDYDLRVFDIIMYTEYGTTYNAYVLKGSGKTALVETAKAKFFDDYIAKVKEIVDIAEIDYLICNHTEPDHSGSIEKLLALNPNITIVATQSAITFLKEIINGPFNAQVVKEEDTLSLGNKTLEFMVLPNLHWPDTMYTYVKEDEVLFTCDSFGSHYAHEGVLRSNVEDEAAYLSAAKYYFDMIIGPFTQPFMANALKRIQDLPVKMICTGHGPVLDSLIDQIMDLYNKWVFVESPNPKPTVIIPYVSAYGYTQQLAQEIAKGVASGSKVDAKLYDMVTASADEVLAEISFADGVLFGTPTIVGEALKPIWDLTTAMFAQTHKHLYASAFGSYGWSGEGVPHIMERLAQLKMKTVEGFRVRFKPTQADLENAFAFGQAFAEKIIG